MRPLVIDNFAGGGGASTGIERAIGRPVDIAINHDPEAVAMHIANHPGTRHYCQSIWSVDPLDAIDEALARHGGDTRKALDYLIGLIWFSPDCKHHSKAKGGKPREKNIRDLAWVVVHWIERLQDAFAQRGLDPKRVIRAIMLENVEEFRKWGPLDADGMPIREREGEEFDLFVRRIKRRGGRVEWRELPACDYGAPTSRKRLYMVIRFDGQPIVWPEPTHGRPGSPEVESGKRLPWRTAAECIDWSIPCPSIFDRKRPLKEATLRRIAHGTMRYVVNAAEPFIVPVTHSGGGNRAHGASETLRTITTANGGEFAVVDAQLAPHVMTMRNAGKPYTGADEPMHTVTANGAHKCAVTAFLSHFYSSNTNDGGGDPREPGKSVTAEGQHHAVVCAHMEQANTGMIGHDMRKPVSTIVGKGCTQRLVETTLIEADALPPPLMERAVKVAAFLIKYYGNESDGHGLAAPIGTVTTKDRFAVVTVTLQGRDGDATTYVIVDIGMRMLTRRELANAQGFPRDYVLDPIAPPCPGRRSGGKPLSISASIRMIGNSVCPDMAEALVRANLPDLCADADDQTKAA